MRAFDHGWTCALLAAWLAAGIGCGGDPSSTGPRTGTGGTGAAAGSGGAPTDALACPANNLTQACTCDDGSAGRQVCIAIRGWEPCDCGQLALTGRDDLNAGPADPPANSNVGITFDDFVMPSDAGDCKPGRYEGTFQCSYVAVDGSPPFEAMGIVSFVLERSANSEVLVIEDGLLDGWGGAFFFAYLDGELSCGTGELSGTATDGFYNFLLKGCSGMTTDMPGSNCVITDPNDPAYVPWTINLDGEYGGTLDTGTDTIDGTWTLRPLDIGGSCDGTFTVTLQP